MRSYRIGWRSGVAWRMPLTVVRLCVREPRSGPGERRDAMAVVMDIVYVAIAVGFFALTWLLVKLCERV